MANRWRDGKTARQQASVQNKEAQSLKPKVQSSLDIAVLKTLAYADVFDQALGVEELWKLLLGERVEIDELRQQLDGSRVSGLGSRDELVCLKGQERLLDLKSQQLQIQNQKLKTAQKYIWLFRLVPWVKLVCVTGSVAGGTPTADDDIDLLIVSAKNRLWLTRLVVTFLVLLTGKRRKPLDNPRNVNNKLCLNMWLSEEHLASEHQDEYVANELARMVPILNRDGMYEKYIGANEWLGEVMPNFYESVQPEMKTARRQDGETASETQDLSRLAVWPSRFLDWLDAKLERWQRGRMRQVTRETVEDDLLMFHPRDYRSEVLERYSEKLKSLGLE